LIPAFCHNQFMRAGLVLLTAVTLAACSDKGPTTPSPVAREVVLAPGQTASIGEASISIRFQGVTGDSRCPGDAICITGGDAQVNIEVIPARGDRQPYVLHTGDMRPVNHADLTIGLKELSPYPFVTRPIRPDDYRAKLTITR
jgi:hypothetical protein